MMAPKSRHDAAATEARKDPGRSAWPAREIRKKEREERASDREGEKAARRSETEGDPTVARHAKTMA